MMYDDIKFNWRTIAVHDEKNIKGFFGEYRWLSNFEPCKINFEGETYPSVENAYMAAKIEREHREYFKTCTAKEAKQNWRDFPLIDNTPQAWDNRKFDVMRLCLWEKFFYNEELKNKLIATGDKYLEETNWWKDTIWGVDYQLGGENHLGKMIMDVRDKVIFQTQFLDLFL